MRVNDTLLFWGFLLIMSLVAVLLVVTENESGEKYSNTTTTQIEEDEGFATIKIDETTGCEYLVFRNIMTPRLDETGTKVRGCKESQ